ncbi:MAG TPA: cytidine deaminase [Candidatus Xenobia bacterium]|jgi:cytidine deaminase
MRDGSVLIAAAQEAMQRTYSPYSNFPVGAAVITHDGIVFSGTNVENASYGLSICAERVALFTAVTAGHRKFEAMAVVSGRAHPVMPCGACRQVMAEFGPRLHLWLCRNDGTGMETSMAELLPLRFTSADLADDLGDAGP